MQPNQEISDILGSVAIDNQMPYTISRDEFNRTEFSALKEYDYFSVSSEITEALHTVREEILHKLLP